jgi:Arc/MetJ-type ribon-helix-helix transcriptional regulator
MTKTPPKMKPATFRLPDELLAAMQRLYARDGISPSEMVRRALTAWLTTKGVYKASATRTRRKEG